MLVEQCEDKMMMMLIIFISYHCTKHCSNNLDKTKESLKSDNAVQDCPN